MTLYGAGFCGLTVVADGARYALIMQAHLVQYDIAWEDREANFLRVREMLGGVSIGAGDLVVLPEMFDSGFSLNAERTADGDEGTLGFLRELAREHGCLVEGGRTVAGPGEKALNEATVVDGQGEVVCRYHKIHPFSYGREPERFVGGDEVKTFGWGGATVCPAVCYDLRFPELFRIGMRAGAEVFAIGANWPSARQGHWRALLVARAIENQACVLGVNRTGDDPHLSYVGGTIAVDAKGGVMGELGTEEAVLSVEVDVNAIRAWREAFPACIDAKLVAHLSD